MPAWFTGGLVRTGSWICRWNPYQAPETTGIQLIPVATSLVVALADCCAVGWPIATYRPAEDRLQIPLLKINIISTKYTRSCSSGRPGWIAEKFTSLYMDQVVIDGFLHSLARFSLFLDMLFAIIR